MPIAEESVAVARRWAAESSTYKRDGDGGQGKRVAKDVAQLDALAPIRPRMFHFPERRGVQRAVRGHKERSPGVDPRRRDQAEEGGECLSSRSGWRNSTDSRSIAHVGGVDRSVLDGPAQPKSKLVRKKKMSDRAEAALGGVQRTAGQEASASCGRFQAIEKNEERKGKKGKSLEDGGSVGRVCVRGGLGGGFWRAASALRRRGSGTWYGGASSGQRRSRRRRAGRRKGVDAL